MLTRRDALEARTVLYAHAATGRVDRATAVYFAIDDSDASVARFVARDLERRGERWLALALFGGEQS